MDDNIDMEDVREIESVMVGLKVVVGDWEEVAEDVRVGVMEILAELVGVNVTVAPDVELIDEKDDIELLIDVYADEDVGVYDEGVEVMLTEKEIIPVGDAVGDGDVETL